ncbi:class I adenylate cyclase [Pseudodesulfovibrio sp.]|uniref:class I adenylate cyclase n=1 Tax=Pseudodesulfovibrio sp. TaxID=2035812 RepID=UPI0026261FB2|nr:class I adenylate cyclase [Pseudodesulfovibrio sp.]MDD3313534.1 class I adenylate cyclase [Pseudodesulfovibrio sp.]
MAAVKSDIVALAAGIRAFAQAPPGTGAQDFSPLGEGFLAAAASLPPDETGSATPVAETALHVFHILQTTKDAKALRACLRLLLGTGRFGRILAVRHVQSMAVSLREMAALLATLPASDRLALAHEMLTSRAVTADRQLLGWLEGLMQPLAAADPAELAPFVASLGRRGEILAFPARQVIDNGLFGKWLTSRTETAAGNEDVDLICNVIRAMDDPERATALAASLAGGLIAPTDAALATVVSVAEAGERPLLDLFLKVLKKGDKRLAGGCLDGIIAQQTPKAGPLLAAIRRKLPALARVAATRVPLLGDEGYRAFLAALTREERDAARDEAFSVLLALAPDFVEALTKAKAAPSASPADDAPVTPGGGDDAPDCRKPGLVARIFGKRKHTLEKMLPRFRNVRDMDLTCSRVAGASMDGRELTGLNLSGSGFREVEMLRCKVSRSRLTACAFEQATITGSAFSGCDFTGTDFSGAQFAGCSFNDCVFTGAAFSHCDLSDCRFRNCAMGGSAFFGATLHRTGFTTSVLTGATFHETTVRSCRFEDMDFTAAAFTSARFAGVEFTDCVLHAITVEDSQLHALEMPGSTVTRCSMRNSDLPHPLFLGARVKQFGRLAAALEHGPLPDPSVVGPEVADKVLAAWAREVTFYRREHRMLAVNRERFLRAQDNFSREKQIYLRILPHLLDTDLFESRFNLRGVPACEVWGYTPNLTTLELSGQFFPEAEPPDRRPEVRILGLYTMGSLGTVAQTASSDIDCWVCYDGDVGMEAEAGLRRKLDALGLWAESEFGLEAHFFAMRMEDVRDNRFTSGDDEESSGSAQALLLKEEFYRTAIRLAGKHLAWWVAPVGVDLKAYDACIQAARRYPVTGQPRLEDFGHLAPVPPDEYFGGSLWQMVKAIHSPFKSVLKLGLLETYADAGGSQLPLCDRIKRNIFLHRRDVRRADPYGALFAILHAHHARRGDREAARLLTEAFMFKANLCDVPFFMNLPARREDASLIRALFGKGYVDPERVRNNRRSSSFGRSLAMGDSVRRCMVETYQRIREGIRGGGSTGALINAEDLTRMGRRIAANFSRKPHKVMRVPFMDARGEEFALLHFSADKHPGKKTVWEVRGGSRAQANRSVDSLEVLHRTEDPVRLLAWIFANNIYRQSGHLQGDRTMAPISVADLQRLLPTMGEFFPFGETFERDINDGLRPERVLRVLIICNLTVAPDVQRVEQASAIYTTNWGEMFCRTFLRPGPEFEEMPSRFLARNLEQPVASAPEMLLFIPKGSQCKRINLI